MAVTPTTSPAPQSWFRRNWKRLLAAIIGIPLIAAGIAGGYFYAQGQKLIQSPPFQHVIAALQKSAIVKDKIGQPVANASWFPVGEIRETTATFNFEVKGPNGKALVECKLGKEDESWGANTLGFKLPSESNYTSLQTEYLVNFPPNTAKFDPNAKPIEKPVINLPPPGEDLNIGVDLSTEEKK